MDKIKVGLVGCGDISSVYLKNCTKKFNNIEVVACADLIPERAEEKAKEFGILKAYTLDEMLHDPEIQIVLNLTIPHAHSHICLQVLAAGKNIYVEKPLAITREDGRKILDFAKERGLLVGAAPDTFLGGGLQTCRKIIDEGWIGKPIAVNAFMMGHRPESWHPDPEFLYKSGGGPMFDMGPYYLTALVSLLGPVHRVTGMVKKCFPQRTVMTGPKAGKVIDVDVPTHVVGVLDFESGVLGNLVTSFDVWGSKLPNIEIYGSEGTLVIPDPNTFGGPIFIKKPNATEWEEIPLIDGFVDNARGIGLFDMADALLLGGEHRASGSMAYHILDIMHGFFDASQDGSCCKLNSSCKRPESLRE